MRIAILYGSTTGKTAQVARLLAGHWPGAAVFDVATVSPDELAPFEALVLGVPTWGTGALQADWERRLPDLAPCCAGKALALFGLGDRLAFPETYCQALGTLGSAVVPRGTRALGLLTLDHDNSPDRTPALLTAWVAKLAQAGLA